MKATAPTLIAIAALLGLAVNLHSQGILPKTPVETLRTLKAKNDELIEKQKATLLKLDEMDKAAEQMRFFSKRS
ncbi:MAG: hypothetical protein WDN28_11465 [Chthoniobacter sp.]